MGGCGGGEGPRLRDARNCRSAAKQFQFIQAELVNLISDHDHQAREIGEATRDAKCEWREKITVPIIIQCQCKKIKIESVTYNLSGNYNVCKNMKPITFC